MPTCSKERRKKIAINYGKTKEEINLTTTTKKVTLKKEKKLKMTRHKNRLPKRRLVLPKNDYKEGNVLVQILNEEHKKT